MKPMTLRLGAAAFSALCVLVSCWQPVPPPGPGLIAFTSRRDGWFSIYTVRPDGTELRKLLDVVRADRAGGRAFLDVLGQPSWSFDDSGIAFTCPSPEGISAVCVADLDGSDAVVAISRPHQPSRYPAWSPDGRIAFTRFLGAEEAGIFIADPDGSELEQLTRGHLDADPTWSPDGEKIAFIRQEGGEFDIYLMNADGTDVRPLTETDEAEGGVTWSPDGQRLAFIVGAPDQDIYVMDADGGDRRNVTRSSVPEGWPTWSPDGARLAFMCGQDSGICVINADGSGRQQIVKGPDLNMQPAWAP